MRKTTIPTNSIGSISKYAKFETAAPKNLRPDFGKGGTSTDNFSPWYTETLGSALAENHSLTQKLESALRTIEAQSAQNENLDTLHMSGLTKEVVDEGFLARMKNWPKPAVNQATVAFDDDLGE